MPGTFQVTLKISGCPVHTGPSSVPYLNTPIRWQYGSNHQYHNFYNLSAPPPLCLGTYSVQTNAVRCLKHKVLFQIRTKAGTHLSMSLSALVSISCIATSCIATSVVTCSSDSAQVCQKLSEIWGMHVARAHHCKAVRELRRQECCSRRSLYL